MPPLPSSQPSSSYPDDINLKASRVGRRRLDSQTDHLHASNITLVNSMGSNLSSPTSKELATESWTMYSIGVMFILLRM